MTDRPETTAPLEVRDTSEPATAEPIPTFHPLNGTPLVFGVVLVGLAALWWAREGDLVASDDLVYVLPGLLIVAGVIGLLAFLLRGRRSR